MCWETAFRVANAAPVLAWEQQTLHQVYRWRAVVFPAPSQILDAALRLVGIQSGFGEPLGKHWPRVPDDLRYPEPPDSHWFNTPLVKGLGVSFTRMAIGFALSSLLGAGLGMLMWRFSGVDQMIGPLFLGLQTLPSVCWVPMSVLLFGFREQGVLFVLVMGSFSAAALSLRDGMRTIPPLYPRAGQMLGASGWRLYRYVLLPASLPALAGSLRTGFSFAWRSLMGAELVFTAVHLHGLGFLLDIGREFGDIAQVLALMIIMVGIGMLLDRWVFAVLQQKVQRRFGLA